MTFVFESFITASLIFLISLTHLYADEPSRIKSLDKMMYTINPSLKLIGPVFNDQNDKLEKTKYVNSLVGLILKSADEKARKYLEAGDTQAYYAYLILGLAVPLHEGLYVHFRHVNVGICNVDSNNAELVKKSSPITYKIFKQYFKNAERPYFPNCEEIKETNSTNQMIRGADGTDLSIMQISIRWHFDDFLANRKYESVSQTFDYGFNLLLSGFDPVYRNISDYKCILETSQKIKQQKINYLNLIKGIWAGKYNSGSISQTCRFADVNSPYRNHDIGFAKNIEKILNFSGTITPDYIGELKLDGNYSLAIKEIVSNFKNNKNERTALSAILSK
ncbi:MAG: hypothetical protein Q7U04_13960 [Bacteriovorax sp.]|nr:hypothetical protein [Bacteriovorax sp.]